MQVEETFRYKFLITHYNNSIQNKKFPGKENNLYLYLYDDYMMIKQQDKDNIIDRFYYKDMLFIYHYIKDTRSAFVFQEKKHTRLTGSFRQNQPDIIKTIEKFINKQIELQNDPNHFETVYYKKNIISTIKAKEEHIYKDIYKQTEEKYKGLFSHQWLDSVLFEDHQTILQYNRLARQKAHQTERKLILTKMKAKNRSSSIRQMVESIPLEKYDFDKVNQGTRFHDDYKKVSIVPKEEDKEEDLIVESLPNSNRFHYIDSLLDVELLNEGMQIEDVGKHKIPIDIDKNYQNGMKLPRGERDKFKLLQSRNVQTQGGPTGGKFDKKVTEIRQFNETIARKIKIWIKIFYRIQSYSDLRREHMTAIQSQLNNLLNSEPKIPLFLERAIQKTQRNILQWKRKQGSSHFY